MSTPSLAFPASLAEKYRPATIAEFVGLDKAKKIMAKFAAHPYQFAWLFVGPLGVVKTSMALALASEVGAEVHVSLGTVAACSKRLSSRASVGA